MRSFDYFIYLKPSYLEKIVTLVHETLVKHGLSIEANGIASISLNDYEIGEEEFYFKVENITSPKSDLNNLVTSAAGGYITYQYKEYDVSVGFDAIDSELYHIDTVSLSFQYAIHSSKAAEIKAIVEELHRRLNALRTIGDESISEDVDLVKQEFHSIKLGKGHDTYCVDVWNTNTF